MYYHRFAGRCSVAAFVALLTMATSSLAPAGDEQENPKGSHAEAIARWRQLKFGLFIHWGPVSLKGSEISWSRSNPVPTEEYDSLYKRFNPVKFDADQWARIAKEAGMKYVVLTTKHHDGFCLFDTAQTDYNIMHTPFGRDVQGVGRGLPPTGRFDLEPTIRPPIGTIPTFRTARLAGHGYVQVAPEPGSL